MAERILALDRILNPVRAFPYDEVLRDDLLDDLGGVVIPGWSGREIPQRELPVYIDVGGQLQTVEEPQPPIAVCPDEHGDIVWFTPLTVTLTDFSLTVRREARPDGSIRTTGGSAVISISTYLPPSAARPMAAKRGVLVGDWVDDGSTFHPVYLPTPLYGLRVSLELPVGVASASPMITVSELAGAATLAVELTENGVLAWRSALESGAGRTIPGVVRAVATVPAGDEGEWGLGVREMNLDTPLGTLLAGRGPRDVRQIDPQQTVAASVVVVGSQLVTTSTVALRPANGQAPASAVLGPAGGRLDTTVVTQHPDAEHVDWSLNVAFQPSGWPVVPASGRLSSASGWITLVKPESWCVPYLLAVMPVDSAGRPVAASTRARDRVQGVLNFTAPYVGGGLLSSTFEAGYARPSSLTLPRYPGQAFGDLVLTVFATVGGKMGQASRRLAENDVVVTALVFPDGRVTLHTANEIHPESSSRLDAFLTRLAALAPQPPV